MLVENQRMRLGANRTSEASEHVEAAANSLGTAAIESTMFGTLSAASGAAPRLMAVHSHHVASLRDHSTALNSVAEKLTSDAANLTAADEAAAQTIRRQGPS